jgi:hypothetical protein
LSRFVKRTSFPSTFSAADPALGMITGIIDT